MDAVENHEEPRKGQSEEREEAVLCSRKKPAQKLCKICMQDPCVCGGGK